MPLWFQEVKAPEVSRKSELQGRNVVSTTHRPPWPPRITHGNHFCQRLSRPMCGRKYSLTPNDHYSGRTAPLTSKLCILYIYSKNTGTEYFKHAIYSPGFSLQNAVCFIILSYLVPILFAFYVQDVLKLKKKQFRRQKVKSMQNRSDTIGNRIRDLPACNAVPQPTAPPLARPLQCAYYNVTNKATLAGLNSVYSRNKSAPFLQFQRAKKSDAD